MLIDQNAVFSDNQTVSETAASTNIVDMTAAGNAVPGALFAVLRTGTAFAGATSIVFALQTADASNFSSATTLLTATFNATQLGAANAQLLALPLPPGLKRYVRAYYTVTGTVTAGTFSCFLTDGVDMK